MPDVSVSVTDGVAILEIDRPPANVFDLPLLRTLSDAVLSIDRDPAARSIVLCTAGKHFCAGADLRGITGDEIRHLYREAFRLFTGRRPIVAAIQGAAIGGGLGLALAADFRIATPDARLSANFARIGFHQGFGLSATLPHTVGHQHANDLLYTGREVSGEEAARIGLCDGVDPNPKEAARVLAERLAAVAPLSLPAIRATLRRELVSRVHSALHEEAMAQIALLDTDDFKEGVLAALERRTPRFIGA